MKNWRSSLAGVAAILSVVSAKETHKILQSPEDLAIIIAGIGLILAKDATSSDSKSSIPRQ